MNAKNYKKTQRSYKSFFVFAPLRTLSEVLYRNFGGPKINYPLKRLFVALLFCPLITLSTLLLLNCCGCQKLEENPLLHCKIFEFETLKRKKSLLLNQAYALVAFSYYYFPAVVLIKSGGREACNNPAYWEKTCDKTIGLVEGSFSAEGM